MVEKLPTAVKPTEFLGSSLDDLREFPEDVQDVIGFALHQAQIGGKHIKAKPLKGFGGAGVLEIVDDYDGDTYRAVYTVKFAGVVYMLHAFRKKSKKGGITPPGDMAVIKSRLKEASEHYKQSHKAKKTG